MPLINIAWLQSDKRELKGTKFLPSISRVLFILIVTTRGIYDWSGPALEIVSRDDQNKHKILALNKKLWSNRWFA
jgi:hypothetical protein